jgi:hypothetical protein
VAGTVKLVILWNDGKVEELPSNAVIDRGDGVIFYQKRVFGKLSRDIYIPFSSLKMFWTEDD